MRKRRCLFLLAVTILLSGCSNGKQARLSIVTEEEAREARLQALLPYYFLTQIQRLTFIFLFIIQESTIGICKTAV